MSRRIALLVALTILYMPDGVLGAIKASIRKRRSRAAAGGAR